MAICLIYSNWRVKVAIRVGLLKNNTRYHLPVVTKFGTLGKPSNWRRLSYYTS